MLQQLSRPATYADIEALPPHVVGEILFDRLHTHPRPAPRHSNAINCLATEVTGRFQRGIDGPGGWLFLTEPELHLGPHVVVPDIVGWRRERMPKLPKTAYIETPPDWLAEVLSPSTEGLDRTDKLAIYAEFRVGHCWYVHPVRRTLEVLELTDGPTFKIAKTFKDADPVAAPPFNVHTFALDALWAEVEE